MSISWNNLQLNRELLLSELRSGKYKKGTTKSDSRGKPIIESEKDNGYCACAIMHDLFFNFGGIPSHLNYRRALDISAKECRLIQQQWNDKEDLSFFEIANRIEKFIFNSRYKLSKEDHEYSKTMYDNLGTQQCQ